MASILKSRSNRKNQSRDVSSRRSRHTIEKILPQSKAISKKQKSQNEDIKSEEYVYSADVYSDRDFYFEEDDIEPELDFAHFYYDTDETYSTDSESVNKIKSAESVKDCDAVCTHNLQTQKNIILESESELRVSLRQEMDVDSCLLISRNEISTHQIDATTSEHNEYEKMDVDCN